MHEPITTKRLYPINKHGTCLINDYGDIRSVIPSFVTDNDIYKLLIVYGHSIVYSEK